MEILTAAQEYIDLEREKGAHDYHPIPVVLERGEGVYLWDVERKNILISYLLILLLIKGIATPELLIYSSSKHRHLLLPRGLFTITN